MNLRTLGILLALLVVIGGGALVFKHQESGQRASNLAALGQPLLKNFKAADVARIRIAEPGATITLTQVEGRWLIAERASFPADFDKVRDFTLKALELKAAQSEPLPAADRARLLLNEPGAEGAGTLVEFSGADARPFARLIVGKKYFRREADGADRAADGRFVLRPEEPGVAVIVSDALAQASAKSADWIDRSGFAAEKVKAIEVQFAGGGGWKIERQRDDAGWKLAGARAGEKLDVSRANAAAYALNGIDLVDVAAAGQPASASGLDKPTLVRALTFDGLTYVLRLGKTEGENLHAQISVSGTRAAKRVAEPGEKADDKTRRDTEFAERMKKLDERLPREKSLAAHTLVIAKPRLDDLLKKRADLLEKKPGAK